MNSKQDVHESSVTIAFAELERLERDRASISRPPPLRGTLTGESFAGAKRAAHEQLDRQARDIDMLRARLLAERPRAWARVRRARERVSQRNELARAAERAHVEAEHRERLARYAGELELTRARLAELAAQPQELEPPTRRALQWSMPAMATVLVAFLGMLVVADEANARLPQHVIEAPLAATLPTLEHFDDGALLAPAQHVEPAPVLVPVTTSGKPSKPSKPAVHKPKSEPKPTPVKPRTQPLKIGDFEGNPLG